MSLEHHMFLATRLFYLLQSTDPPSCFIQQFSDLFLSIIRFKYNRILITGDFNLHIDMMNDPLCQRVFKPFKQHEF